MLFYVSSAMTGGKAEHKIEIAKYLITICNCAEYSGLGPGTLVGSAAFDLFPIHAVCVVVPKAGEVKKIADIGVWLVELFWSFWAYIWLYLILEVMYELLLFKIVFSFSWLLSSSSSSSW